MSYYIDLYKLNVLEAIKELPFSLRDIPMSFKRFNIGHLKFSKTLLQPAGEDIFKILELDEALTQKTITIEESSLCSCYTYAPSIHKSLNSKKELRTCLIKNATIRSQFHVFAGDKFIRINQSYTPSRIQYPFGVINYVNESLGIFALPNIKRPFNINLKVFLLASWADKNYFHFFMESLGKVKQIHKLIEKIPSLYVLVSDSMPYQHYQVLFYLIPPQNIMLIKSSEHLVCKELYISEFPVYLQEDYDNAAHTAWYVKENIFYLSKFIISSLKKSKRLFDDKYSPKRIFLHRKRGRIIKNFSKILGILKKYGFTILDPSEYDFEKQANIFYNAQVILGMAGAAMTNIIFCRRKTKVLLILADIMANNPVYPSLAHMFDLEFKQFAVKAFIDWFSVFRGGKTSKFHSNLILNCTEFDNFLHTAIHKGID